jgi:hypothetical protein
LDALIFDGAIGSGKGIQTSRKTSPKPSDSRGVLKDKLKEEPSLTPMTDNFFGRK